MQTTTYFSQNKHALMIRECTENGLIEIVVDDKCLLQVGSPAPEANYLVWFSTDFEDAQQVLLRFRRTYSCLDRVELRVDPSPDQLREMKLSYLNGCEHYCDVRPSTMFNGRPLWANFTDDLGSFIERGFRMSLAHLLVFVVLYATCMAFTIPNMFDTRVTQTTNKILACGFVWLLSLGLFYAAALGHRERHRHNAPERRGWTVACRMGMALATGVFVCFCLYQGWR